MLSLRLVPVLFVCCWTLPVVGQPSPPATQPGAASQPAVNGHPHPNGDAPVCAACHACDKPTASRPCLHGCPRPRPAEFASQLEHLPGPEGVILLDMLSDARDVKDHFGPVPFDHTGHAKWAEIAGGCTVCHHYTEEGAAHPACRTCHERKFKHDDMRRPGLKGAYHRQCLGCHREWSHETKCGTCHLPRIGERATAISPDAITKDDSFGRMHPPIPEPDSELYQTKAPADVGSRVYFHHKRHTHEYGFKCAECHRGDSCVRCHEYGKKHVQRVRGPSDHHRPCSACHAIDDRCGHCHLQDGDPEPRPFTHASTGWPLKPYHARLGCRKCHTQMPFRPLERKCGACHQGWDPDEFDHAVTGQGLDDNHAEIDCGDCHVDERFDRPPSCEECHEPEDGVKFPERRPGPARP